MSKLVSMRLDDDVISMVEAAEGKNFTDKFQRLIKTKNDEYEILFNECEYLKQSIENSRKQLIEYRALVNKLGAVNSKVVDLLCLLDDK